VRILFGQIALLLALSVSLAAQDNSKSEIFGGFQFGYFGSVHTYDPYLPKADNNNTSLNIAGVGWDGTYTRHINDRLGVAVDFAGAYGKPSQSEGTGSLGGGGLASVQYKMKVYTIAVGPVYYLSSKGDFKPFVHALVGGGITYGTACASGIPCAPSLDALGGMVMYLGGGVDKKFNKKLSFRGQFDWFYSYGEYNSGMKNIRLSAGVAYHF